MYIDTTPGSVPSRASSSSCLLAKRHSLPYLTGLNWFAISHRFVQFSSLSRQMQLGSSHDLLHMLNSSYKAVSSAVAPHIHWITCCSSTSMHRPLSLGLGTIGTVDRKGPRFLNSFQTLLCLMFEVQHNICCTYGNQKSERTYWFHKNSR